MKKRLSAVLAAVLLISGCTAVQQPESSDTSAAAAVTTEPPISSETAAEETMNETKTDAEETTVEVETSAETEAAPAEDSEATEFHLTPEDYYPAMPEPDEAAMSDEALKAEITEAVKRFYFMGKLECGACFVFNDFDGFFGEKVSGAVPEGYGEYYEVKGVADKASLVALFRETFTENYLSSLDPPLEEQLFGDIVQHDTYDGETVAVPYFKEMDGKLLAYSAYMGVAITPDYDGLVITSATAEEVCVSVAGTCLSYDEWDIGEVVLKKVGGVWKTDSLKWRDADYMGKLLSERLNSHNLTILSKICGNVTRAGDEKKLINDRWYYTVLRFMTIEEMREFLRDNFTYEAAKLYEPYIDCFIEQDGILYYTNNPAFGNSTVFCPNPKSFGNYDLTYSSHVMSTFSKVETAVSRIPWDDGSGITKEVLMVLANGKIACELPCTYIGQKNNAD